MVPAIVPEIYNSKNNQFVYKKQKIRLPVTTKEEFINNFFEGLTDKTKVIFISHITAATALILPVKEIVAIAKSMGLITIVDGAHVPGHIPISIKDIDADFYTGAAHKWMMAAKGCSFLYAHKRVQHLLKEPLVVSWGYKAIKPSSSKFLDYNQFIGTCDFSAFLTIPTCIQFMQQHNWSKVAEECSLLAIANAKQFYTLFNTAPLSPLTSEWIGQMVSIPIATKRPQEIQRKLFTHYNIEVPLMPHAGKVYLRYSVNGFNTQKDLNALYKAMEEIIINEN